MQIKPVFVKKSNKLFNQVAVLAICMLFVYNTMGYLYVFNRARNTIRHEIKQALKQGVPPQELHVFKIGIAERNTKLKWVNHKEFWYNGNIYDVVSKKQIQDTLVYNCINDIQEKQLFEKLNEYVHKAITGNKLNTSKAAFFLIKPNLLFFQSTKAADFYTHVLRVYFRHPLQTKVWQYTDIPTPPPKYYS